MQSSFSEKFPNTPLGEYVFSPLMGDFFDIFRKISEYLYPEVHKGDFCSRNFLLKMGLGVQIFPIKRECCFQKGVITYFDTN